MTNGSAQRALSWSSLSLRQATLLYVVISPLPPSHHHYPLSSSVHAQFSCIDIIGEDNKTIVCHKVTARVVCVLTEQAAQRVESHQNPPPISTISSQPGSSGDTSVFNFTGTQHPLHADLPSSRVLLAWAPICLPQGRVVILLTTFSAAFRVKTSKKP